MRGFLHPEFCLFVTYSIVYFEFVVRLLFSELYKRARGISPRSPYILLASLSKESNNNNGDIVG